LVSDLNRRDLASRAGDILDNVNEATRQLDQLLSEVTASDQEGYTAGRNIRESLTNANRAAGNLADATEALKPNFLTRGFFKNRGYYTLEDLPPDKYRSDRIFARKTNRRVWLAGHELFRRTPDGDDEISDRGKETLDAVFSEYGDFIFDNPMVIE